MSQAKVDKYKKEKLNRKKVVARNRFLRKLGQVVSVVLLVAVVGGAGYGVYAVIQSKQPVKPIYVDSSAIDEYLESLDAE